MHGMRRLKSLVLSAAMGLVPFLAPAQAQTKNDDVAALVRQDFSDCSNSNVNANNPSLIGGMVAVVRQPDGTTAVKVAMTASRDTTYHFFLKCVRLLGDITTDDEGVADVMFTFRTNEAGSVYAFDMYPEGAPAGNKFQSMQIDFK
jgi:hypothetical protein